MISLGVLSMGNIEIASWTKAWALREGDNSCSTTSPLTVPSSLMVDRRHIVWHVGHYLKGKCYFKTKKAKALENMMGRQNEMIAND